MNELLKKHKESVCACETCQSYCARRPCWPTPEEADKILDAGFARRLMRDWWVDEPYVYIICPANEGCGGEDAPSWPSPSPCLLFKNGLCELHGLGLKPFEGRAAHHDNDGSTVHKDVADTWRTTKGKEVVERWQRIIDAAVASQGDGDCTK